MFTARMIEEMLGGIGETLYMTLFSKDQGIHFVTVMSKHLYDAYHGLCSKCFPYID